MSSPTSSATKDTGADQKGRSALGAPVPLAAHWEFTTMVDECYAELEEERAQWECDSAMWARLER